MNFHFSCSTERRIFGAGASPPFGCSTYRAVCALERAHFGIYDDNCTHSPEDTTALISPGAFLSRPELPRAPVVSPVQMQLHGMPLHPLSLPPPPHMRQEPKRQREVRNYMQLVQERCVMPDAWTADTTALVAAPFYRIQTLMR